MTKNKLFVCKFDLLYEFNKYNKLLFNNELKPVVLKLEYNKIFFGKTRNIKFKIIPKLYHKLYLNKNLNIKFKIRPKTHFTQEITISSYYDYDYDTFKNILIHEMVHVFIIQKNYIDNGKHGDIFLSISKEIDKKGFNCSITSMDNYFLDIYDKSNLKNDIYIIMYKYNEEIYGSVFDSSSINKIGKMYFKTIKHKYGKDFNIIISKTNNYFLKRYTVNKNYFKKIICYRICENYWKELIKYQINLKNVNNI